MTIFCQSHLFILSVTNHLLFASCPDEFHVLPKYHLYAQVSERFCVTR